MNGNMKLIFANSENGQIVTIIVEMMIAVLLFLMIFAAKNIIVRHENNAVRYQ
jgi:hypothetical protein